MERKISVKGFDSQSLTFFKDEMKVSEREYDKQGDVFLFSSKADTSLGRIMSNHYGFYVVVNGVRFNGIEQLFAVLHFSDYPKIQRELMGYSNVKKLKDAAKSYSKLVGVRNENGWNANLLMYCMRLKYKYCREFREGMRELALKRGNGLCYDIPTLVEYCSYWRDPIGGTNDIDGKNWGNWKVGIVRGQNTSGRLMQRVFQEGFSGLLDAPLSVPYKDLRLFGEPIRDVA